ncbi:MAG: FAD-dependent oxidoreductase [Synergistaceae bacterium]|nr:FAD-dependent oxidoreductase [Synergistaceae bacterium]MBQ3695300.1 FAD-dependent oxidoreductase [Synergistaceae bacterium]
MRKIFASLFIILTLALSSYAQNLRDNYDIVIAGGGMGGIAAAIQASHMDMNVLVVESTNMLGGQAVASGVSTMDDLSRQRSGLYREFMNRIEEYYSERGKSIQTCYWNTGNSLEAAFEPFIGHKILSDMARGEDAPDILYHSQIIHVGSEKVIASDENGVSDNLRINSVIIQTPEGKLNIACKILIDATEYGDILPLAGVDYRAGNSITPNINKDTMIQDITWTAIIRKYPEGIPEHLKPKMPLPGYDHTKWNYERYVTKDGGNFEGTFPVKLPVNFAAHNAYRGLPDSFLPGNYDSDPQTWNRITKTQVNWGNDYPGYNMWKNTYGLPAEYLENKKLRKRIERDALIKTLHFIYYVQNELNESWSVDENEYGELPEAARDLPDEWKNIARHLPPAAYVRESRRIIGEHTLTSKELYENSQSYHDGHANNEIKNAIAVGRYVLDLHHSDTKEYIESELGEEAEYIKAHKPAGDFQVPMDILIPRNVDGLIAAEKNLSMSRIAAGALRLQPICMMTGQAAGALAAAAVRENIQPRNVKAIRVQRELLNAGVILSLCDYADVLEGHKFFASVQLSNLYGIADPVKLPVSDDEPGTFGVDEPVNDEEIAKMKERAEKIVGHELSLPALNNGMTRGEAVDMIIQAMEL